MKIIAFAIIATSIANAELVETSVEWESACGGSTLTLVTEEREIRSVRAFAAHSHLYRAWTIHYAEGIPVSAEYIERTRGKIMDGDHAGEDSGKNPLKIVQTFTATDGKFRVEDKKMGDDLAGVLKSALSIGKK